VQVGIFISLMVRPEGISCTSLVLSESLIGVPVKILKVLLTVYVKEPKLNNGVFCFLLFTSCLIRLRTGCVPNEKET